MNHNKHQARVYSVTESNKLIDKFKEKYVLSFSSLTDHLRCPRLFFYTAIRKLELVTIRIPFVTGNHVNQGLHEIYKKNKRAIKDTIDGFRKNKTELMKLPMMTPQIAEQLEEQELIIRALLRKYVKLYSRHIAKTEHIDQELRLEFQLNDRVLIKGFIDNVLKQKKDLFVHEVKTTSTLTEEYVNRIQIDLQSNLYFHIYNILNEKKPMKGIIYDVLRKPTIHWGRKKQETRTEYLNRLEVFYDDPQKEAESFYMEIIEKPRLSRERVMDTVKGIARQIDSAKTMSDFYCNDQACYIAYGKCQMFDVCHSGENTVTLFNFRDKNLIKKGEKY